MRLHFQIYFNRQRNTDRLIRTTVITDLIRDEKGDEQRHNPSNSITNSLKFLIWHSSRPEIPDFQRNAKLKYSLWLHNTTVTDHRVVIEHRMP